MSNDQIVSRLRDIHDARCPCQRVDADCELWSLIDEVEMRLAEAEPVEEIAGGCLLMMTFQIENGGNEMNGNHVFLIGRLHQKAVLTRTKTNVLMASFFVSTLHRHVDNNGKKTTSTQLHPVCAYAGLAEFADCLFPPTLILVEGRLRSCDGNTVVVAATILPMLGAPAGHSDEGSHDDHQSEARPALTPSLYHDEKAT